MKSSSSMKLHEALREFRTVSRLPEDQEHRREASQLIMRELRRHLERYRSYVRVLEFSDPVDICQDVLLKVLRSNSVTIEQLPSAQSASAYLHVALRNHVRELYRKQSKVLEGVEDRVSEGRENSRPSTAPAKISSPESNKVQREGYHFVSFDDEAAYREQRTSALHRWSPEHHLLLQEKVSVFLEFCEYVAFHSSSRESARENNLIRFQWIIAIQKGEVTIAALMEEHGLTRGQLDTQFSRVRKLYRETLDRIRHRHGVKEEWSETEELFFQHSLALENWGNWLNGRRPQRSLF